MMELIDELWFLPRHLISEEYDRALNRLTQEFPMKIHEVPTGTRAWTWTVPEAWSCSEAYLENKSGKRVLDLADHPLHVVSYSLPFDGEVSREELLQHLHVHLDLPDAIPYVFKYYQRDWGFCASQKLRDSLMDKSYHAVIRSEFKPGSLKIGEIFVPGETDECFVIASHLDHPAMVNDDLTGVVVALEAARRLMAGPKPYYSYRFLFFPETLGSIAYLSQHEDLIPKMLGGVFLEMLGNDAPHALQTSFQPDSPADIALFTSLRGMEPTAYVGGFRTIIDNDERQFNAPGVRVPMLSLSRVVNPHLPESRFRPYPEYHSSLDTPDIVSGERLETSVQLVLGMLHAFDRNRYIVNQFKGEVFASGYDLWVDYKTDEAGHKRRFEIMDRCDGTHRPAEIASELGISFQEVWTVVEKLLEKKLVFLNPFPQPTDPHRS
jgi:aminopeptidase-like protein